MTRIFISHSHSDEAIVYKLVNFLLASLGLQEKDILCTSNPDQGLDFRFTGIADQLKNHLKNSEALIILITADSLHSAWIPFEAGSFWTTDKPIIPILGPGLTQDDLPGPLKNLLIIPIEAQDSEDRLNNATNQLAKNLNLQQEFTKRRNYTQLKSSTGVKIIKIFLASSSELKDDREKFEIFINRKNKEYIKKGTFLELLLWEDFLNAMSKTRLQDEYKHNLRPSISGSVFREAQTLLFFDNYYGL